ncbi:MAG TPA: hypothetical protein VEQ58_14050 [Polyangiaceae bacterium]|nr:hypothetical protein [Polyangiaceae bacterium]
MRRAALGALGSALACALTTPAHAATPAPESATEEARVISGFRALDRPTGMAEAGFGWLTLPGADVCSQSGCKAGDTSFELDGWQLYRANLRLAFGAGLLLGLIPTTDAPSGEPTDDIQRDHTRKYLTLEGMLRYYPYVGQSFEFWAGLTGGLVVLSDRFQVVDVYDKPLIGPAGVTIRTEGGTLGVAFGGAYELSRHWSLGASLRVGSWFLPDRPATDPLLDKASVTGRNSVFSLGFNVAYRIGL